jgi:hypothetical protein
MCFIGHGVFGIITKSIWCNYFAVFGIGHDMAYRLMPFVGIMDILQGIIFLFYPIRGIAIWLVFWGAVTASLRPMSGESFAELIERAGNYGAPLALLLLSGSITRANLKKIFQPLMPKKALSTRDLKNTITCLQVVVFLLILGHGWLNIIEKKSILQQYANLGFSNPHNMALTVGILEIAAAFATLVKPAIAMLLTLLLWKAFSEMFYPHWELFEWIERGGSYGSILALWLAIGSLHQRNWARSFQRKKLWTENPGY